MKGLCKFEPFLRAASEREIIERTTSFEFMSLDWISIVVNSYSAIHLPLLLGATHYVYTTWVFVWIVRQILFVNLNVNFALY